MGTGTVCGIIESGIGFVKHTAGLVTKPYETYRNIVLKEDIREIIYIGCVVGLYFALASLIRTAAFRPFLLTKQFIVLAGGAFAGYMLASGMLWVSGRILGARTSLKTVMTAWGYSLLPTVAWFMMTSVLYIVLPPPRTTHIAGIVFSAVYLTISVSILFWKVICAYLAVRFSMKFDLVRICTVYAITLPVLVLYSFVMYRLGIFRIPFL